MSSWEWATTIGIALVMAVAVWWRGFKQGIIANPPSHFGRLFLRLTFSNSLLVLLLIVGVLASSSLVFTARVGLISVIAIAFAAGLVQGRRKPRDFWKDVGRG